MSASSASARQRNEDKPDQLQAFAGWKTTAPTKLQFRWNCGSTAI